MSQLPQKKKVSFSQYSKYQKCPYNYYLDYVQGKRIYEASLNTCFGTAIHFALQTYIEKLYTDSAEVADSLDLTKMFQTKFAEEVETAKSKNPNFKHTDDEYTDFLFDGDDILKSFLNTSNRIKHFPSNKYEFIGTEFPLDAELKNNVEFIAFVDLILKNKQTGKIKIIDIKTSSMGWNQYKMADSATYEQVILYKVFYAKKFNIPLSQIEVEFFILKRKLYENVGYPQSRIQLFSPSSNSSATAITVNSFSKFISECFNEDGTYKLDGRFPKIPGKNKKNCKYCPHKKVNCDAKADILEEED